MPRQVLLKVDSDTRDGEQGLAELADQVKRFDRLDASARIDIKTAGAEAQIEKFKKRVQNLSKQAATPAVQLRTAAALAQLERAEKKLEDLDGKTATVDVRVGRGLERLNVALGNTTAATQGFQSIVGLVKMPALITGAGLAAQGVSALGAGAVATGAALGPLSGAMAAYPALGSAVVQSMGVFKLATKGLSEALAGNEQAMKNLTPEGRGMVRTLQALQPEVDSLRRSAQQGLFPGLESGIKDAAQNVGVLRDIVRDTGRALGGVGADFGAFLGRSDVGADLALQGERNATSIRRAGKAGIYFADALRHVTIAAGPLVDWMSQTGVALSRLAARQASAGRESGRLAEFFESTRDTMQRLGSIASSVAGTFLEIGKAAAPLGRDILKSLDEGADSLERWSKSTRGRASLRQYFKQARGPVFEMGRLLRDAGAAFIRLGNQPGVQRLIQAVRTDLVPALENVIGSTTKAFGPVLIDALTNLVRLFEQLAGSNGPLTMFVKFLGQGAGALASLVQNVPLLQPLLVTFAGMAAIMKTLKLAGAITGVTKLANAFRKVQSASKAAQAADAVGGTTTLGQRIANNVMSGFRGLGDRIRGALRSAGGIVRRVGRSLGRGFATVFMATTSALMRAADGIGSVLGGAIRRQRTNTRKLGKMLGRTLGLGLLAGLVLFGPEIYKMVKEWLDPLGSEKEGAQKFEDRTGARPGEYAKGEQRGAGFDYRRALSRARSMAAEGDPWSVIAEYLRRAAVPKATRLRIKRALGMRLGGLVPGSGIGDVVPAMLEPGEFVVNRQMTAQLGPSFLNALNAAGRVPAMAGAGGHVPNTQHFTIHKVPAGMDERTLASWLDWRARRAAY